MIEPAGPSSLRRRGAWTALIALALGACGGAERSIEPSPSPSASTHSAAPVASADPSTPAALPSHSDVPTDPPPAWLSGRVTGPDGDPVEGVCLDVYAGEYPLQVNHGVTRTGPDGSYALPRTSRWWRAADRYGWIKLRFRDCRPDPTLAFVWAPGSVDERGADEIGTARRVIDLQLAPGGAIKGIAMDTDGSAARGVCALLYDGTKATGSNPDDSDLDGYVPIDGTSVARDGTYAFRGLAAKQYRVRFITSGYGEGDWLDPDTTSVAAAWCSKVTPQTYGERWWGGADGSEPPGSTWPVQALPIIVGEGETRTGVDVTLARHGSIGGTVQTCSVASAHVSVEVFDASGTSAGRFYTGRSGRWSIGPLADGSYRVWFHVPGCADEWYDDARGEADARIVKVSGHQRTPGIDAALTRG